MSKDEWLHISSELCARVSLACLRAGERRFLSPPSFVSPSLLFLCFLSSYLTHALALSIALTHTLFHLNLNLSYSLSLLLFLALFLPLALSPSCSFLLPFSLALSCSLFPPPFLSFYHPSLSHSSPTPLTFLPAFLDLGGQALLGPPRKCQGPLQERERERRRGRKRRERKEEGKEEEREEGVEENKKKLKKKPSNARRQKIQTLKEGRKKKKQRRNNTANSLSHYKCYICERGLSLTHPPGPPPVVPPVTPTAALRLYTCCEPIMAAPTDVAVSGTTRYNGLTSLKRGREGERGMREMREGGEKERG